MARIRSVKPSFFTDETLAEVSRDARLLAIALFTQADCKGRMEDRPRTIKLGAFPWDDVDVDALLDELQAIDFICRYKVDGRAYLQIRTFEKHQRLTGKEAMTDSELPGQHSGNIGETPVPYQLPRKGKGKGKEEEREENVAHACEPPLDRPTPPPTSKETYTDEQLSAVAISLPSAAFVKPYQVPEQIAIHLRSDYPRDDFRLVHDRWHALGASLRMDWCAEALGRPEVQAKRDRDMMRSAARHIGKALQDGFDLLTEDRVGKPDGNLVKFPAAPPGFAERPWLDVWITATGQKTDASAAANMASALGADPYQAMQIHAESDFIAAADWVWENRKAS